MITRPATYQPYYVIKTKAGKFVGRGNKAVLVDFIGPAAKFTVKDTANTAGDYWVEHGLIPKTGEGPYFTIEELPYR